MAEVSVILPCFNADSSIRSSVQSILNQTFEDWELIIVDDASTDQTVNVVSGVQDKRVRLVQLSQNSGYPVAMKEGIAQAIGKYIARMDADDVSAPGRLQEQLKALELHPHASFCGVARYRITPGGKRYTDKSIPKGYYQAETWEDLMQGNRIFTDPSVMMEKEKALAVGGYRSYQRSGMDVDLWLRMMEKFGSCITITKPLFGKGLDPNSLVFNPNTYLNNQVPRILALQRRRFGKDDVDKHGIIDFDEYLKSGLLKEGSADDRLALLHGTLVTCIWLRDWHGVGIYWKKLRSTLEPGFIVIIRNILILARKLVSRLMNNPYVVHNN